MQIVRMLFKVNLVIESKSIIALLNAHITRLITVSFKRKTFGTFFGRTDNDLRRRKKSFKSILNLNAS